MRQGKSFRTLRCCRVAALVVAAGMALAACNRTDPNRLWEVVHGQCVPGELQHHDPAPCAAIDLSAGEAQGFALLKDIHGPYQYLLIPTARISGIESPDLLGELGARYFRAAWEGRQLIEKALKHEVPVDSVSLAVNSRYGRSQEQLHIHLDCLKPEVRAALKTHLGEFGERWGALDFPLEGHRYRARRVEGVKARTMNPFQMLADSSPDIAGEMGRHTLVVAGAVFEDGSSGFILLDDRATLWPLDRAHGEELQDHLCQ